MTVETIHGEKEIELEKGINNNVRYILKNYGAPHLNPTEDKYGDHIIKFKIVIPTDLSEKQKELIYTLKNLEEAQGIKSGDMDRAAEVSRQEREYKVVGEKNTFWNRRKSQKPSNMQDNGTESIFKKFKSMLF